MADTRSHIIKFADDTALIGLLGQDEVEHGPDLVWDLTFEPENIQDQKSWCYIKI